VGMGESPEYKQLQERGIEILDVKIYNVQLDLDTEMNIASQWSGEWLKKEKKEAGLLDDEETTNEVNVPKDAVKDFARIASKKFDKRLDPRPDTFTVLQMLIEPLIEVVRVKAPVDDDQKSPAQKLNEVWKWLVANKPPS